MPTSMMQSGLSLGAQPHWGATPAALDSGPGVCISYKTCPIRANSDPGEALIVVDVQIDFCPGGALPTDHGDEVVPC